MKRTPTQEKARRADRKAIERAILKVLRNASLKERSMGDGGRRIMCLYDETVSTLSALETARRAL